MCWIFQKSFNEKEKKFFHIVVRGDDVTNEKYCKYAAYYGNLYNKINRSDPYVYNPEQSVYDQMEQMLFGMIIVAADIDDTVDGLYKLEAYIVHLINEYENGNDELYMISRSYKKNAPDDKRTCIGYVPVEMLAPYTWYMRTLFVERNSGIKDERVETAKKRMHIEYLDELYRKVHEYIQEETGEKKHTDLQEKTDTKKYMDLSSGKISLKKILAKARRR